MSYGNYADLILPLKKDEGIRKANHQSPANLEIRRYVLKTRKGCWMKPDLRQKRVELV